MKLHEMDDAFPGASALPVKAVKHKLFLVGDILVAKDCKESNCKSCWDDMCACPCHRHGPYSWE